MSRNLNAIQRQGKLNTTIRKKNTNKAITIKRKYNIQEAREFIRVGAKVQ